MWGFTPRRQDPALHRQRRARPLWAGTAAHGPRSHRNRRAGWRKYRPANPAGPGRQQPNDACAGFPDIEPMDTEEAEEDAQQQRHRLAFRRRRPLRCGDADRALLRAGLPAGARRIRQARPGDPDGRVTFSRRADRVLQTLRAEADARAFLVKVYPDTRGNFETTSEPCTHAVTSCLRFLAFSHLWHNITMPKLVKSILHSHL